MQNPPHLGFGHLNYLVFLIFLQHLTPLTMPCFLVPSVTLASVILSWPRFSPVYLIVSTGCSCSNSFPLSIGVPQASLFLFSFYACSLGELIKSSLCWWHPALYFSLPLSILPSLPHYLIAPLGWLNVVWSETMKPKDLGNFKPELLSS